MDRPVGILYDTVEIPGTTTVAGRRMRGEDIGMRVPHRLAGCRRRIHLYLPYAHVSVTAEHSLT